MSNFNLEKGDKFNLSKDNDALVNIKAELSWSTPINSFPAYDLDVSLFGLKQTPNGPKLVKDDYFVYYNHANKRNDSTPIDTFDGAITKSPDETVGGVEWIVIRLNQVDPEVDELSFIITIHKAVHRGQTFKEVHDSMIKIINDDTGEVICQYKLGDDFPMDTSIQIGSLIKNPSNEWVFEAVGVGFQLELGAFVEGYTH